ncbi:MAG: SDR family NAD(P)-dependent oxidoreductase [Polyangiales bacterium]
MITIVTGAAGFIGSHVCDRLLLRGDRVVGVDNLNDYYDPERKKRNLQEISDGASDPSKFEFVREDLRNEKAMHALVERVRPDSIVHLGAMAGVRASIDDPELYIDVNLKGTMHLLEAARRYGNPRIVFASTSSVYGPTETIPFVETDAADRPLAPYPASKRAAELLGYSYHHLYGLDFTALRFFTVYGPRGRPDMMAYKVLDNIFRGADVPLYNDGDMHRDWTYVDDIVSGIEAATERSLGFEQINLGRGEPTRLGEFVQLIESLAGKPATLRPAPMPAADISYTFANIDKAKRLLDYNPTTSVEQGVRRFWHWYQAEVLER